MIADCYNPSNIYAVIACVGPLVCEENRCGIPVCDGTFCLDGAEPQEGCPDCDVSMCPEAVSCGVTNCGACTNHYFDAAGNQVCLSTNLPATDMNEPATLPECTADADCNSATAVGRQDTEYYCAQGVCRAMGSCGENLDCHNPSNIFAMIECVGFLHCDSDNLCAVECGSGCEDGSEWEVCDPVPCDDPAQPCPQATSCFSDICNGCNAVYLDAAGKDMTADCPIPELFNDPGVTAQDNGDNDGGSDSPAAVASLLLSFVVAMTMMAALSM
jgi:hypothetical protein